MTSTPTEVSYDGLFADVLNNSLKLLDLQVEYAQSEDEKKILHGKQVILLMIFYAMNQSKVELAELNLVLRKKQLIPITSPLQLWFLIDYRLQDSAIWARIEALSDEEGMTLFNHATEWLDALLIDDQPSLAKALEDDFKDEENPFLDLFEVIKQTLSKLLEISLEKEREEKTDEAIGVAVESKDLILDPETKQEATLDPIQQSGIHEQSLDAPSSEEPKEIQMSKSESSSDKSSSTSSTKTVTDASCAPKSKPAAKGKGKGKAKGKGTKAKGKM